HRERRQDTQGAAGGMPEQGILAGEDDVAVADELGAPGKAIAVDLGDGGFGQRPQPLPSLDRTMKSEAVGGDGEAGAGLLGALEVVAGGEGASGAADDHHARVGVRHVLVHHQIQLMEELLREGVELLGTVEGQPDDFVLDFLVDEGFVSSHLQALRRYYFVARKSPATCTVSSGASQKNMWPMPLRICFREPAIP